jgi:enoyl-CoA hydratase
MSAMTASESPAEYPAEIRMERIGRVAVLTVSNPPRRNALTRSLAGELAAAVQRCEADDEVGALVVTGEPPAFCAGGNPAEIASGGEPALREVYAGFLAVARCALPTVAAVNGVAVGAGLNLALACDVRLAGPEARFDARFLQLGLHPGGGYTWMVQRALGAQGAAALTLFCDVLDAAEAERVGLVWRQVPDVVAAAVELAARAAAAPRRLAVTTKRTLALAAGASHGEVVEAELREQLASLATPEFAARLAAMRTR